MDEVETTEPIEPVAAETGEAQGEQSAEAPAQEAEEIAVTFGEEPAPEAEEKKAPEWVKNVRELNRKLERKNRELEAQLRAATPNPVQQLGNKPTLQDFDYDSGKYEEALASWFEKKRKVDEQAAQAKKEEEQKAAEWQARLSAYGEAKTKIKAPDYEDAESTVTDLLDVTQQGIIIHGAKDPAMLVYALGKNEAKAKELAAIKDPVKFAFAVAQLEMQMKVTTRKPATQPERVITGNGRPSGTIDPALDRLREEAARTGDYTKVNAYKRQKRS